MQKIFSKYSIIIISSATFFIVAGNFCFQRYLLEKQQYNGFSDKIDQIIHTMENNQVELDAIKSNLDEDYLTRAKAAAYVLEQSEDLLQDEEKLQNLAELLDVDEIHVTDENGILIYSSVPAYIGMDFQEDAQTAEFLSILEGEEDAYLIQEAQPNAAEGKIMKYVGIARKSQKGIIQIGLEPERQMEAQERNTYEYIFSRFPTNQNEEFFAVSCETGEVIGHTNQIPEEFKEVPQLERLSNCEKGAYKPMSDGGKNYVVIRQYEDVLIGAAIPADCMYSELWKNMLITFLYLLLLGIIITILLNYLVKKKVVEGIHAILNALSEIANGNLETKVKVGGIPEFEELSGGINTMVKSIVSNSNRIAKIMDMSGLSLAAFEYQKGIERVFVTSGIRELLSLDAEEMEYLCRDAGLFYERIQAIMQNPVDGEKDTFSIHEEKYIRIHLSDEPEGFLGIITDVTKDVIEKKQIQYCNNHDALTGLSIYPYFKQKAAEKLLNMQPGEVAAVVMLDLDSFKEINDTFGHDMGDMYLQQFAVNLRKLPKNHCLVSRRSGDEFCMAAFGYHKKTEILQVLDRFWNMLEESKVALSEHKTRSIRASGGVAWVMDDSQKNLNLLLNQADEALYKAKRQGKGYYEA